jgi:hypothetical protein
MSGPGEEDHLLIKLTDYPIQVKIDKRQTRARPPMAKQAFFNVLGPKRFFQ